MKYKHLSSREKREIIEKHFNKKISQAKLAIAYGTNRTTINILCRNHARSPLLKKYHLNDKEIIDLYVLQKKSIFQIATLLKISTRPIKLRLKLAGVIKKVSKRKQWEKEIPHYYLKMKIWTAKVIERDGMKCMVCKVENTFENRLEANHIIPVRDMQNADLLFDTDNGICLCRKCHMKIHYHEKEHEIFFRNLVRSTSSV
jgi:hypothetical protein